MSVTFILDASSLFYRSYHASKERPTFTKDGIPNAAVNLLRIMITRLTREYKPDFMIAACDSETPTFRSVLYPQYKAQRSKPEPFYTAQRDGFREVLWPMPIYQQNGYEADDIIGTLCERIRKDSEVVIVSGDKDMAQLVNEYSDRGERVQLLNTNIGKILNVRGVVEEYGVWPHQVTDYLALVGDVSDNVPGALGVGPLGALAILKQFRNVEEAVARSGEIECARWRHAVQDSKDLILLSKKLVTIDCAVPGI
jgi:DNA polymerase-1